VLGPEFADLVDAARRGDEYAFGRLWRDIHPPLLRYLQAVGAESVDDLAADVWLEVARKLQTFGGDEGGFRGWVFTLARRRLIDSWRRGSRAPAVYSVAEPHLYERPGADYTAKTADENLETRRALALIATLPREQAEVIALRVVGGLSAKDVAEILGKSPGAVRIIAHRGLRRLAALLVDQNVEGGVTQ
jgi:RNA polymerase sigma-70 factor, ECF subfamily